MSSAMPLPAGEPSAASSLSAPRGGMRPATSLAAIAVALAVACGAPAQQPAAPAPSQPAAAAANPAAQGGAGAAQAPAAKPQAPLQKVTLGVPAQSLNFLPMYLGEDKGIFAEEGLDLGIIVMATETSIAGILSGSLDYTAAVSGSMRSAISGAPVRAMAFVTVQPTFYLMSKPDLRRLADLRGKTITSTSLGSNTTQITKLAVARAGMDPQNDVQVIGAGNTANAYAALQTGQVDAAVLSVPYNVRAERDGFYPLLYAGDVTSSPESGLGVVQDRVRSQPDQVKAMIRGILRSVRYIREHKPESVTLIARDFEVEGELADGAYVTMVRAYSQNGEMDRAALEEFLREYTASAGITQSVTPEDVTDLSIVRQAQRELGL
jgi:NitT/TauT family transport system substrate-binding protein